MLTALWLWNEDKSRRLKQRGLQCLPRCFICVLLCMLVRRHHILSRPVILLICLCGCCLPQLPVAMGRQQPRLASTRRKRISSRPDGSAAAARAPSQAGSLDDQPQEVDLVQIDNPPQLHPARGSAHAPAPARAPARVLGHRHRHGHQCQHQHQHGCFPRQFWNSISANTSNSIPAQTLSCLPAPRQPQQRWMPTHM